MADPVKTRSRLQTRIPGRAGTWYQVLSVNEKPQKPNRVEKLLVEKLQNP